MVRSPPSANDSTPRAPFHAHPSDLELIKSYLRPWVDSGLKAGTFIHVSDVYAAGPAALARQFEPAVAQDGERAWYFLTPLRRKSVRGKRKARTVATGEGWWHNEAKSKPVIDALDDRRLVGYRQSFSFMTKDARGQRTRTGWIMLELRLESGQGPEEDSLGSLVLCKVYRSPRHPGEPAATPSPARRNQEADEDESSAPPRRKGKMDTDDDEGSNASQATADDEIPVTASVGAPGRKEKEADDEDSAETWAAVPANKRKAADDESSVAASAAEPARSKRKIDGSSSTNPPELHCPQCGCHLDAETVLAAAKSKPETKSEAGIVQVEGDSLVIGHSFHQFF